MLGTRNVVTVLSKYLHNYFSFYTAAPILCYAFFSLLETTTSKNPGCATRRACLVCLGVQYTKPAAVRIIRNGHGNGARHCVVDIFPV